MAFELRIEAEMPAKPGLVMDLLTDERKIAVWSGDKAVLEPREGGAFSMFDGWATGTVQKINKQELVYTWKVAEWSAETPESTVSIRLEPAGEHTKLILEHKNLPSQEEVGTHKVGWYDYFLVPLEDYIMILER